MQYWSPGEVGYFMPKTHPVNWAYNSSSAVLENVWAEIGLEIVIAGS
jgi:hypothetical protein